MRPTKNEIHLKKLCRATHHNVIRLFSDSCFLFSQKSYASAFFLALVSIEETGKLSMIDHWFADMVLNREVQGHPEHTYVNGLFSKSNFFNHVNKQNSGIDFVIDSVSNNPHQFKKIKAFLKKPEIERQRSLYVDFVNTKVILPKEYINSDYARELILISLLAITNSEGMAFSGSYWYEGKKLDRKSKAEVTRMRNLYTRLVDKASKSRKK